MKRNLLTFLLLCGVLTVFAIPARRGVYATLRLADGSQVRAELRGDEYAHYFVADDGRAFVREANSDIYSEVSLTSLQEQALTKRAAMAEKQTARRAAAQKRTVLGGAHDPYVGTKKCLVVLVNFADTHFREENDLNYYKQLINEPNFTDDYGNTHSVRDYYLSQSYDQLAIDFDVAGPIQLEHDYAYYGQNDRYSYDLYAYEMVQEACQGAYDEGYDFSNYDWDGDGEVDQVFVLFAGNNEASDWYDSNLIWPHMAYLTNYDAEMTFNGVTVNTYACSSELIYNNYEVETGNGIGAMCHEFSHCMGLPDAYPTDGGDNYGMSAWSIMDQGLYNGDNCGYLPSGYTAYERMYCGWLEPIELTEECDITGMKGLTEGGEAYIAYNPGNANEYYLFENRSNYGFDAEQYGYGMLVTHLDYSANLWRANVVNTLSSSGMFANNHERYAVVAADNSYNWTVSNIAADLYPTSTNTHIDNNSIPAFTTYNINKDGTYYMNISVTQITKADDGSISFHFYPAGTDPYHGNRPEGATFYESFDYCSGTGGNDGNWGDGTGTGTFTPDNSGWSGTSLHGAYECAMFGSNTQRGNVYTPTFTISEESVISFRAAPYQAAIDGILELTTDSEEVSIATDEITIPQGTWTDFTIKLIGTGSTTVRFREMSGINRFFLDEVAVLPITLSGIETIESNINTKNQGVYSLDGIYLGNSTANLKKGIYILNGKKQVIK